MKAWRKWRAIRVGSDSEELLPVYGSRLSELNQLSRERRTENRKLSMVGWPWTFDCEKLTRPFCFADEISRVDRADASFQLSCRFASSRCWRGRAFPGSPSNPRRR